jgi:hypothetical protein
VTESPRARPSCHSNSPDRYFVAVSVAAPAPSRGASHRKLLSEKCLHSGPSGQTPRVSPPGPCDSAVGRLASLAPIAIASRVAPSSARACAPVATLRKSDRVTQSFRGAAKILRGFLRKRFVVSQSQMEADTCRRPRPVTKSDEDDSDLSGQFCRQLLQQPIRKRDGGAIRERGAGRGERERNRRTRSSIVRLLSLASRCRQFASDARRGMARSYSRPK